MIYRTFLSLVCSVSFIVPCFAQSDGANGHDDLHTNVAPKANPIAHNKDKKAQSNAKKKADAISAAEIRARKIEERNAKKANAEFARREASARRAITQNLKKAEAQLKKSNSAVRSAENQLHQITKKETASQEKLASMSKQRNALIILADEKTILAARLKNASDAAKASLSRHSDPAAKQYAKHLAIQAKKAEMASKSANKKLNALTNTIVKATKDLSLLSTPKSKLADKLFQHQIEVDTAQQLVLSLKEKANSHAAHWAAEKAKENSKRQEAERIRQNPNTLRVILPEPTNNDHNEWTSKHSFHNKVFLGPFNVPGDGDCFFYAAQKPRAEMIKTVNANAGREDIRKILSLEIAQANAIKTKNWDAVTSGNYPIVSELEFIAHTTAKYLNGQEFATCELAKCCALALNWNLYIWSQNKVTKTLTMSPGSYIEHQQPDQTVHVLLRGEHFYILVPEDAPAEEKMRAETIADITAEYVQAVVNKKGNSTINALKKRVFLKKD